MQVLRQAETEGIDTERLNTSNAGHSALIDPMLEPLRRVAETFAVCSASHRDDLQRLRRTCG